MIGARRFWPARLVGLCLVALAAPIGAAAPLPSGRVTLLDPAGAAGTTARDCLNRIRAELTAGGFDVALVDPGPHADPISMAEVMERQQGAVATVALVGEPGQRGAELWILDRVGSAPEVRRVPADGGDREHLPEVLAIRTIEILRASALKLLVQSMRPAVPPPPEVRAAPAAEPQPSPSRPGVLGLEAGVSVLDSVGGAGMAALPLVRLRFRLGDRVFARLTAAGLGSRPRVETMVGSATLDQSLGLAELGLALRPGRRLRPTFALGGGALHVVSEGVGTWPSRGLRTAHFTGAVDAGVGLLGSVTEAVSFAFEVHGLVAFPHPAVRFFGAEAATLGFPAVLASLSMVASL